MMYGHSDYPGNWGSLVMIVSMVVLLAVLIGGFAFIARYVRKGPTASAGVHISAEDLLAERFARGDIDEDDYLTRLATIRSHR